jgi:hypothetical protein
MNPELGTMFAGEVTCFVHADTSKACLCDLHALQRDTLACVHRETAWEGEAWALICQDRRRIALVEEPQVFAPVCYVVTTQLHMGNCPCHTLVNGLFGRCGFFFGRALHRGQR